MDNLRDWLLFHLAMTTNWSKSSRCSLSLLPSTNSATASRTGADRSFNRRQYSAAAAASSNSLIPRPLQCFSIDCLEKRERDTVQVVNQELQNSNFKGNCKGCFVPTLAGSGVSIGPGNSALIQSFHHPMSAINQLPSQGKLPKGLSEHVFFKEVLHKSLHLN